MSSDLNELEKNLKNHWLYNPEICQKLYELAHMVVQKTEGHHVIAIGQSPAWVVAAAKIIKPEFDYQHVAITGGIIFPKDPFLPFSSDSRFYTSSLNVTSEQEKGYRGYLKSQGITPQTIVNNYQQNGKKTVVFDFVGAGSGITSFLYILHHWACDENLKESIQEALVFLAVQALPNNCERESYGFTNYPIRIVAKKNDETTIRGCSVHFHNDYFQTIRESKDEGPYSDRLVPLYRKEQWLKIPEKINDNEQTIQILQSALKKEMEPSKRSALPDFRNLEHSQTPLENPSGYNIFSLFAPILQQPHENLPLLANTESPTDKGQARCCCAVM